MLELHELEGDYVEFSPEQFVVAGVSADTEEFIPWHNTQALGNGIKGLNSIFNYLEDNSPLKLFLQEHCSHLLKPLEGNRGISVKYAKPSGLSENPDVVSLSDKYTPAQFDNLPGSVGVYVFYNEDSDRVMQCGSSIRLSDRMFSQKQVKVDSSSPIQIFHLTNGYLLNTVTITYLCLLLIIV